MPEIGVTNVLGTVTYRQELALDTLAETFSERPEISNVVYEPAENHWLQTWFRPDDTYVAFYRSGRCSIAGARSIEHLYEVAERVNQLMRDLLEFEYEPEVKIDSIVATADLEIELPLNLLAIQFGMDKTEYEPEQFPGLIYRGMDHVVLLFASGTLVCTGLNDLDRVVDAVEDLVSQVQSVV